MRSGEDEGVKTVPNYAQCMPTMHRIWKELKKALTPYVMASPEVAGDYTKAHQWERLHFSPWKTGFLYCPSSPSCNVFCTPLPHPSH